MEGPHLSTLHGRFSIFITSIKGIIAEMRDWAFFATPCLNLVFAGQNIRTIKLKLPQLRCSLHIVEEEGIVDLITNRPVTIPPTAQ